MHLPHEPVAITVDLPRGPLALVRPADPAALVERIDALDADERLPYWAELWPSALALAAAIEEGAAPVTGRAVLELGAGLGLVSLAAARAGAASVLATDWDADAVSYAAENARRNGLAVEVRLLDWRTPPDDLRADVVVAADVLYERRNAGPIAAALAALVAPGGEAWIADPRRTFAVDFLRALDPAAWTVRQSRRRVEGPHLPRTTPAIEIDLYRVSRAPASPPAT